MGELGRRSRALCCARGTVSCLDEDPEAHARLEVNLDKSWEDSGGQFTVGTGLEEEALTAAGIERADAFIASTDGDNTNIVISQIAKRKFNVPTVVTRILDPLRAEWYEKQGVNTVCPTRIAIEMLEKEVLEAAGAGSTQLIDGRGEVELIMGEGKYIIAGAGKVGWNLARELLEKGNEVTVIENNRNRYLTVEQELAQHPVRGRLGALGSGAGRDLARRHGDRGHRRRRGQHADLPGREGEVSGRPDHRAGEQPAERAHFELLGIKPYVSATDLILRLLEHEVP